MINARPFLRAYRDAGALHEVIGARRFVEEGVFATPSGVGMVLAMCGVDCETLPGDSLDRISQRFLNALRVFHHSYRVYQYLIKREERKLPEPIGSWDRRRSEFLEAQGLFSIDLYIVVVYEPTSGNRLLSWLKGLSLKHTAEALDRHLRDSIEILRHAVTSFTKQADDLLGVETLDTKGAIRFFAEVLNPDPIAASAVALREDFEIGRHAANTRLDWSTEPFLRWGEYWLRAFVLRDPPSRTLPGDRSKMAYLLRGIQKDIATNMILCSEWKPQAVRQTLGTAKLRRRIRAGQTNISAKKSASNQQQLNNIDAQDDVEEIGEAQRQLRRDRFGGFSLTVLLFDRDEAKLRKAYADLLGIHWDGVLIEEQERRSRFTTWLATIPGNASWNLRRIAPIHIQNYVDLSFLYRMNEGQPVNVHLRGPAMSTFETEDRTPFFLNLHQDDVAHAQVLGATGAGKSMLLNQVIGDTHSKYGGYTFILDVGGSYRAITREFGGAYVAIDLGHLEFQSAPLAMGPTEENLNFEHQFVRCLMLNEGKSLSTEEDRDIYRRLRSLTHLAPHTRRLSWLNSILQPSLKGVLHRWIDGGPYAAMFDNWEDTLELSRFQTFDFTKMSAHPQAIGPLMFYLFHRVDQIVHDPKLAAVPKTLYIDEGWKFILDWVVEAIKTWRKHNGWVVFVTQSDVDLPEKFREVLNETCPNKIFLPNPGADVGSYGEAYGLNARERILLGEMTPREEFLVKTPYRSHRLNYRPDPAWREAYERQWEEKKLEVVA